MTPTNVIMAVCALVTALSAVGAFTYVRRAFNDAAWSRRVLEGEAHREGLVETVAANEQRSQLNAEALQSADLRADGGRSE